MVDIYDRLYKLDECGEYYNYYPNHLCTMSCFTDLHWYLNQTYKREQYIDLYLREFEKHISFIILEKKGKLRPIITPDIVYHLGIDQSIYILALTECLSFKKYAYFRKAVSYLNKYRGPAVTYHNISKRKIRRQKSADINFNEFVGSTNVSIVRFFNALEVLTYDEQIQILVSITRQYLQYASDCSFSEMILEPGNLSHGEIILVAKNALSLYDADRIEACRDFFRKQDAETSSTFRMNV